MKKLYFKLAIRNLLKNRTNTIINTIGFSIGLASALYVFLFVQFESSFDKFIPNADKIFRLTFIEVLNSEKTTTGFVYHPVAEAFKNEVPGIKDFVRVSGGLDNSFKVDNVPHSIEGYRAVDANFFHFFPFELSQGNKATVLDAPNKIVLTKSTAKRIFGTVQAIGKVLNLPNFSFTVSGIAEDPPENTHIQFEALLPIAYIEASEEYYLGWNGGLRFLSYIRLEDGVNKKDIESHLSTFVDNKFNERGKKAGYHVTGVLQSIKEVHFSQLDSDCSSNRDRSSMYVIGSICFLILLLAMANYISLITAQKQDQEKSISVFKIQGAHNKTLIIQSLLEIFIITFASSLLGVLLLFAFAGTINSYVTTAVDPRASLFTSLLFSIVVSVLLSAVITLFATSKLLRNMSVITTLHQVKANRKEYKSNTLVVSQFAVVVLLMISVLLIRKQIDYLIHKDIGIDKNRIATLLSSEELEMNKINIFKQELLKQPEIDAVSLTSQIVGRRMTKNGYRIGEGEEFSLVNVLYTDADFINCFGVELTAGRNFKTGVGQDDNAIIVNNRFVKKAEWEEAVGRIIQRHGKLEVVGVVNDFNFISLETQINPLIIMRNPKWDGWGYNMVNIRFNVRDVQPVLRKIDKIWAQHFPGVQSNTFYLQNVLANNYAGLIEQKKLVTLFSIIALLLSCMGLYGLTMLTLKKKIKEIGVRRVNGAKVREILTLLNTSFLWRVLISVLIACPVGWFIMRKWLESFAYKTTISWWVFFVVGLTTLLISALTISIQSWRAASRNPVEALRYE